MYLCVYRLLEGGGGGGGSGREREREREIVGEKQGEENIVSGHYTTNTSCNIILCDCEM